MTLEDNSKENNTVSNEILKKFQYSPSLLYHWINSFGLNNTINILEQLRNPPNSLWIQVNTDIIDYDSLYDIFEENEFDVQRHTLFDDFLEVKVKKREIKEKYYTYPAIRVDVESASNIALGKDVHTSAVTKHDKFAAGERVRIVDLAGSTIAVATSEVESKEISKLSQRIIARVTESFGYAPPLTELKEYRRGYFNILTPAQTVGVKSLYLDKQDNILVMSVDRGEVAGYIAKLTNHKCPITVIARNEMHLKAVKKQLKRIKSKAIRVIHTPFLQFLRDLHEIKYSSIYVELPNSRTALMPVFSSNLSISKLKQMAKSQLNVLSNLYRCLHGQASISYITHSLDYLENENVFKSILGKAYYDSQSFPEEIRLLQNKEKLKTRKPEFKEERLYEKENEKATIFLDPIETQNNGGFIAKFKFKQKET
ncbi:MAG: PUA domain-containing protein [Candidatus Thorarchaeota archaeon]